MDEMSELIGATAEQVRDSPFILILVVEYLKTKFNSENNPEMKTHLEYILADIENANVIRGGMATMRRVAQKVGMNSERANIAFGKYVDPNDKSKGLHTIKSINEGLAQAKNPDKFSEAQARTSDRPAIQDDFLERCDNAIKKLEKHCDGEDVMKLIQKMLELINTRLNQE